MTRFIQKAPDVVWWKTPTKAIEIMLEVANIQRGDVLYDVGCGDGEIVITAAKKYGIRCVGFDVRQERVTDSRANIKKNNLESLVSIQYKDIFTVDMSPATVVTMYLLPKLNLKMINQLKVCRPGTRVVSYDFDMGYIKPEKYIPVDGHSVYMWTLPFKKDIANIKKPVNQDLLVSYNKRLTKKLLNL